ncbi:hypothetical protein CR194_13455 [Salipaludibacillus keqinensis]|uniref:Uncharacterized protein n=1 Tax=Salipaludibacillus keqinensis TaxID=2045207 RepID=A0A323TGI0_9BACI|nr:hypothetical protein [Salipaludibacillus keqinensis]PYZ92667.1 hypothetical protein CR194_13455 [Salipaludibacillus keqinensis]
MFKWVPHKEQYSCERKLMKVMKRLKIKDYIYNWDRTSCFIEFGYLDNSYRLEHSLQKAKEKGMVMLKNGLDCMNHLIQSLEDLSNIIERGTYKLEMWLSSMKKTSLEEETDAFLEEVHIRYSSSGKQNLPNYYRNEEFTQASQESSLDDYDPDQFILRGKRKV